MADVTLRIKVDAAQVDSLVAALKALGLQADATGRKLHGMVGDQGLNRTQILEMAHVARGFADAIAAGINPLKVLAFESGRIAQIFSMSPTGVGGTLKNIGTMLVGLVSPMKVAAISFAAFGLAAVTAFNDVIAAQDRMLKALRAHPGGGTLSGLMSLGAIGGQQGGLSVREGQSLAALFAGAGVSSGMNRQLIALTGEFVRKTGEDATKSGEMFAKAFEDPTKGAQALNKELQFLDDATLREITNAQSSGNAEKARRLEFEALSKTIGDLTDRAADLSTGWQRLSVHISDAWRALGLFVQEAADPTPRQELDRLLSLGRTGGRRGRLNAAALASARDTVFGTSGRFGAGHFGQGFGGGMSPIDRERELFVNPQIRAEDVRLRALQDEYARIGLRPAPLQEQTARDRFGAEMRSEPTRPPEVISRLNDEMEQTIKNQRKMMEDAPIRASENALHDYEGQVRLLIDDFGKSAGAVAAAAEKQKLLNEYWKDGIVPGDELNKKIEEQAKLAGELAQKDADVVEKQKQIKDVMGDIRSTSEDVLGSFEDGLIRTHSAVQALRDALKSLLSDLLRMANKQLMNALFGTGDTNDSSKMGLLGGPIFNWLNGLMGVKSQTNAGPGGYSIPGTIGGMTGEPSSTGLGLGANAGIGAVQIGAGLSTGAELSNQQYVWNRLINSGMSKQEASVWMGMAQGESSFDPSAPGGAGERGLFQWRGDRLQNLLAQNNGQLPGREGQVDYFLKEVGPGGRYHDVGSQVATARTIPEGVGYAVKNYEVSANQADDIARRIPMANAALEKFGSSTRNAADGLTKLAPATDKLDSSFARASDDLMSVLSGGKSGSGFGSILGGVFGGVGSFGKGGNYSGQTFDTGFGSVWTFHEGGTVGDGGMHRHASRGMFVNAPRFHSGLGPREMPAILERGEVVLSRKQLAGMGGRRAGVHLGDTYIDARNSNMTEAQMKDIKQSIDAAQAKTHREVVKRLPYIMNRQNLLGPYAG